MQADRFDWMSVIPEQPQTQPKALTSFHLALLRNGDAEPENDSLDNEPEQPDRIAS